MRFLKYIKEDFYQGIKSNIYGYQEIFINPLPKEIKEVIKNSKFDAIRFAADLEKHDLFIWPTEILHHEVIKKIKLDRNTRMMFGEALMESNKLKITGMDSLYTLSADKNVFEKHIKAIKKHLNWINSKFYNLDAYIKKEFLPSRQSRNNFEDLCNAVGKYL